METAHLSCVIIAIDTGSMFMMCGMLAALVLLLMFFCTRRQY